LEVRLDLARDGQVAENATGKSALVARPAPPRQENHHGVRILNGRESNRRAWGASHRRTAFLNQRLNFAFPNGISFPSRAGYR